MTNFFRKYSEQLELLCKKYKVDKLYAFGSVVKDNFRTDSDIDLIVHLENMPPEQKGEYILAIWDELETLFAGKVDLLTDQKISNPILSKNIENSKILIYDRKNKETFV